MYLFYGFVCYFDSKSYCTVCSTILIYCNCNLHSNNTYFLTRITFVLILLFSICNIEKRICIYFQNNTTNSEKFVLLCIYYIALIIPTHITQKIIKTPTFIHNFKELLLSFF